ncbi:MAG: mitomycin antibiotic biosynthesis protein [Methylococcales symbiont of Hymedesmia sp. n. MRB-2018]|nr:MAG: mitomycin antibiotic biosynthesis protein [Methylococcales symbiont of Hymedesmia sp. n. MRB-2018]
MDSKLENLIEDGLFYFGEILDVNKVNALYKKMITNRKFDKNIFMDEKTYKLQKNNLKANPTVEFNFLNQFKEELSCIENNEIILKTIQEMLGDDYEIVLKKAVCGVPDTWLPKWIKKKINNINVANLGAYVKPEYRDITYFRGIDFHQDIIDWPKGSTDLDPSTFLTLYVYLHDVSEFDSPLYILPKTHKFGATLFPHKLKKDGNLWSYKDDGREIRVEEKVLTGRTGYSGIWHNCTLHGTMPVKSETENFRLSLRYLIGKSNSNKNMTGIDKINEKIKGNLVPIRTRIDLDERGLAKIKGNIINNEKLC